MQLLKKINKQDIIKWVLFIISIPIIMKILYFINILGIMFGTYLREISICIN